MEPREGRPRKRSPAPRISYAMAADPWPTTLYEYDRPVIELNRFGQKGGLAAWRRSEISARTSFLSFILQLVGYFEHVAASGSQKLL
jgi:hypothetical protein